MPCSEGLLLPGVSLFGAYQFPEREQTILMNAVTETLQLEGGLSATEASLWGNCLTFHHQWMVLSRQHALALVALKGDILKVSQGRGSGSSCDAGVSKWGSWGSAQLPWSSVSIMCECPLNSCQCVPCKPTLLCPPLPHTHCSFPPLCAVWQAHP